MPKPRRPTSGHVGPGLAHTVSQPSSADVCNDHLGPDRRRGGSSTARHGPNELQALERASAWHTLAAQFKNVLILILLAATLVSSVLGHALEATVIAIIVLFAVLLGFIQEYRAERALEALKKMAAPLAHVIREGSSEASCRARSRPGRRRGAPRGRPRPGGQSDYSGVNLTIDEAALTGESRPSTRPTPSCRATPAVADRRNMAYAGTVVTYGRGQAIVVATGMSTEFGQISRLVQTVDAGRTPLQENLDTLGRTLGKAALVVVALIVVLGSGEGLPLLDMLIFGIALAVAVVPEALPAVVTISLAIGVRRMVKRNALVRRLPVVETLGSTSVICSDKTGTLTKNEMTVRSCSRRAADSSLRRRVRAGRRIPGRRAPFAAVGGVGALARRGAGVRCQAARAATGGGTSKATPPKAHWSSRRPRRDSIRPAWINSSPHRRDSLQLRTPTHDDAAQAGRRFGRIFEGRG